LLAHCASLTVNAVKLPWERKPRTHETADKLATAVALDMTAHWTPTVRAYLGRVTKAHIVAAVREALGDEAWETILGWHNMALREVFVAYSGEEISTTGDGFFVSFDSPDLAVEAAIAIQRRLAEHRSTQGFAPQLRIGLHASDATQVGGDFHGKGVHEAARIAALGGAGDIVASVATVGESHRRSGLRDAKLKGFSESIEVVNVDWR